MEDRRMLGMVRKAIEDFKLIEDGDKVALGLSGGKDSMTLLYCLAKIRRFLPQKFELYAIMIDLGFKDLDQDELKSVVDFCKEIEVELHIVKSDIAEIVFDVRKEKNPCSLCANMRRGGVNKKAKELGCNKVALAHSSDDFVETFLLSFMYEGRLSTIQPETYLSRMDLKVIRPLLYCDEADIIKFAKSFPILHNPCPADKNTKRQYMKDLIKDLSKDNEKVYSMMKTAIYNTEEYNLFDTVKK